MKSVFTDRVAFTVIGSTTDMTTTETPALLVVPDVHAVTVTPLRPIARPPEQRFALRTFTTTLRRAIWRICLLGSDLSQIYLSSMTGLDAPKALLMLRTTVRTMRERRLQNSMAQMPKDSLSV
jgi:hypothetical protein